MAFNSPTGFLCYNTSDLIADGYIYPFLIKEYKGNDLKNFIMSRLENPPSGVIFTVVKDEYNGEIVLITERRKLLPASKIKLEIVFGKVVRNSMSTFISPDQVFGLLGSVGAGAGVLPGLSSTLFTSGGIASGTTNLTYQICNTQTKINYPIIVTQDIKDTGIINFEEYPLSIFGVVKEVLAKTFISEDEEDLKKQMDKYQEDHPQVIFKVNEETGATEAYLPFDFSDEQVEKIGKFSSGMYEGGPIRDIEGATDKNGLFGGAGNAFVRIEDDPIDNIEGVLVEGQEQLFIKIIRDERKIKFRGDNLEAIDRGPYPFKSKGLDDVTDKSILIKNSDLKIGDTLYITFAFASKRHIRQTVRHLGKIFQDNAVSVLSKMMELDSKLDINDYTIKSWLVPNIEIDDSSPDEDYKLSLSDYLNIKMDPNNINPTNASKYEEIEGWRMSNTLTSSLEYFWAADHRGILLVNSGSGGQFGELMASVLIPASEIRDTDGFFKYVNSLSFNDKHTDEKTGLEVIDKYNDIEDKLKGDTLGECVFDVSEPSNSLLFDREKLPYYKPFALYLQSMVNFDSSEEKTGIGVPLLDIIANLVVNTQPVDYYLPYRPFIQNLDIFTEAFRDYLKKYEKYLTNYLSIIDCSFIEFDYAKAVPVKSYSCQDYEDLHEYNYSCHTYDPSDGPGVYASTDYMENTFLMWTPGGGTSNSYWKLETPYYCGDFGRKSRVYIEDIQGNSFNSYSWIYVETDPSSPNTISLDENEITGSAILSFRDNNVQNASVYHQLDDGYFEQISSTFVEIDSSKSNIKESFDHDENKIIGYNHLLGISPNYSQGVMIMDDFIKVHYDKVPASIYENVNFLDSKFGLNFKDTIPTITIPLSESPGDWAIKTIEIKFSLKNPSLFINNRDRYISLYFENEESSITNLIPSIPIKDETVLYTIDCKYYKEGPIQFYGKFWDYVNVEEVFGVVIKKDIEEFKVNTGQTSVVNNREGKILIFYSDEDSGNISVVISYNDGETWIRYKDIIRLLEDEFVSLPFALPEFSGRYVHLFYCLNDTFLMSKLIEVDLFNMDDIFIDYIPPISYDENSIDDEDDNKNSSLYNFSEGGKKIRREPSYFVVANSSNDFFQKEKEIYNKINEKNKNEEDLEKYQHTRFDFYNMDESNFTEDFNGNAYSLSIDKEGVKRLFMLSSGKLTLRSSSNLFSWNTDISDIIFHKNLTEKEETDIEIKNIQVIRNNTDENDLSILYFYKNMLFIRRFDSSIFFRKFSKGNSFDEESFIDILEVDNNSNSRPLFLMGKFSEDIKTVGLEEDIINQNLKLAIQIPPNYYTYFGENDVFNVFDDRFLVDTDTQPFGYFTKNGVIRVFYKDSLGFLNCLDVNGDMVYPESLYRLKREVV